jgi:hypothetical protein
MVEMLKVVALDYIRCCCCFYFFIFIFYVCMSSEKMVEM